MALPPDPAAAPGRRRWLAPALVVSLGVNLAVLGFVAGLALHGPPKDGPRGGPSSDGGLWRYGADLPEPYRDALMRALRESRGDWGAERTRWRGQREAVAAALVAEPFDPAAVAAALGAERALMSALAERGTALLLAQIERMDPEARRAYAAALLDERHGPPGRPHD